MRHLLPLLLVALSACHATGTGGAETGPHDPVAYGGTWYPDALQGSVWYDEFSGFASVDLNRPAHVALFALNPGAGMRLIYPVIGFGGRASFDEGSHILRTSATRHRFTRTASAPASARPTYILMVASDRPLDIEALRLTGALPWLNRQHVMWNPYTATEALARRIVPQPAMTDWTVAYHLVWPDGVNERERPQYTWIRCPSGVILSVPVELYRRGAVQCPRDVVSQPDTTAQKPDQKIADRLVAPWRRAVADRERKGAVDRAVVSFPMSPKHRTPEDVISERRHARPLPPAGRAELTPPRAPVRKPEARNAPSKRKPAPPPPPKRHGKEGGGSEKGGS